MGHRLFNFRRRRVEPLRVEQQLVRELGKEKQLTRALQNQLTMEQRRVIDQKSQLKRDQQRARVLQNLLTKEKQQVTELQEQLNANQQEMGTMREQLKEAEQNSLPRDWVIKRSEIEIIAGQQLGQGSWGQVCVGRFRGCNVAVKEFCADILSPRNRHLFESELVIASECRHPCLLQFIGAVTDDGTPLLITEIMDCSLRERLYNGDNRELSLSREEVCVISLDVARALNYLHRKPTPIVHQNISSANVLLWRRGDQWRAKVSAYRTANVCQSTRNDAAVAMYYAPEALNKGTDQLICLKVDVYIFGVLLCEMCIRQEPDPRQRERQVAEMRNRNYRDLVTRCVTREPSNRPNMEEIIEYLERLEVKETGWLGKERLEMRKEEMLNEVLLEWSKRKRRMWRGRRKMLQAVEKEPESSDEESIMWNKNPFQSTCKRWPCTETIWIDPRRTPGQSDEEQSESSDEEETVSKGVAQMSILQYPTWPSTKTIWCSNEEDM